MPTKCNNHKCDNQVSQLIFTQTSVRCIYNGLAQTNLYGRPHIQPATILHITLGSHKSFSKVNDMRHATPHTRGICKAIDCKQKAHINREVSSQTWYKFGTNILWQKWYQHCEQPTTRKFLKSVMPAKHIQWLPSRLAYFDHRFRLVSLALLPKWSSTTKTMTIHP